MTLILLKKPGFVINHEKAVEIKDDLFDRVPIQKIEAKHKAKFAPKGGLIHVKEV